MKRLFWLLVLAIVVLAIVAATFPAKLAVRLLPSSSRRCSWKRSPARSGRAAPSVCCAMARTGRL